MRGWVLLAWGMVSCGADFVVGGRTDDVDLQPAQIAVSPEAFLFGGRKREERVSAPFEIRNAGGSVLTIESLRLEGAQDFTLTFDEGLPVDLVGDNVVTGTVSFMPQLAGDRAGSLWVHPDTLGLEPVEVPLRGLGDVGTLEISPDPVDFGVVPIGCVVGRDAVLRNVGRDRVQIAVVDVPDDDPDLFVGGLPTTPYALDVGVQTQVRISKVVRDLGPWALAIPVVHDAPSGPTALRLTAQGVPRPRATDRFAVPAVVPVDVLYVIDHSGSMAGELPLVVSETEAFSAAFLELRVDGRIAVLTGVADACFTDVISPDEPDWGARLAAALVVQPGDDTTEDGRSFLTEAPLESVARATRNDVPGGCNEGFRRAHAPLHVIVFSDEPDQSSGFYDAGPTYWRPWYDEVAAWGAPQPVTWHGVVDIRGACGLGAGGHEEVVNASGGVLLDVCQGAWTDDILRILTAVTGRSRGFELSHQDVVPASVEVRVDGVLRSEGWTFIAQPATIIVEGLPPDDTEVEVSYERVLDCPA